MEKPKKLMTLVIVYDHPRILLGMKKKGFGVGRWNGFGGKVEEGETIEEAAQRELFEESGVVADGLNKVGIIEFELKTAPALFSAIAGNRASIHDYDNNDNNGDENDNNLSFKNGDDFLCRGDDNFSDKDSDNLNEILEVHIFKTDNFNGEPKETEEMSPKWFFVDEIPFVEMWPDDRYWFPYFLRGRKFKGKFLFGEKDTVLDYYLQEVENL